MPFKVQLLLGMLGVQVALGAICATVGSGEWRAVALSAAIAGLLWLHRRNAERILVLIMSGLSMLVGVAGLTEAFALLQLDIAIGLITVSNVVWGILVSVFAIYVLTRPEVKTYFGAA